MFDVFGSVLDSIGNIFGGNSDRKLQSNAMKKRIRYTVRDAQEAGVHPLYALGAPAMSPAPTHVATDFAGAGQAITRARMASQDAEARRAELARTAVSDRMSQERHTAELRILDLEAQMMASQIARLNSAQLGPPTPQFRSPVEPGPRVQPRASDPIIGAASNPARQPGQITDYQFFRDPHGNLGIVPSEEMKQRIEDNLPAEIGWWLRNNLAGVWNPPPSPNTRDYPLPEGFDYWRYNRALARFEPARRRGGYRPPYRRRDRELR